MVGARYLFVGVGLAALCAPQLASAQDAPVSQTQQPQTPDAPESGADIVVTGIRASIARSLSDKRNADTVSDVITAEDIGKLPDNNIAETLSRVSGVQIRRRDGDGSSFSVRGISQNRLELNGRTFIGPTENGDPALESLNPEILSGLEVIKSPSADMAEGALGAIVNLRTKRPLDLAAFVVSGRVEGVYSSQSKDLGYRTSGLVSKSFADDTIGVLLSGAYTDAKTRAYTFETSGWTRTSAIDTTGDGVADANRFRPNRLQETLYTRRDKRATLNGVVQYKPSDHLELLVEGTYSRLDRDRDQSNTQVLLGNAATGARADTSATITAGTFTNVTVRPLIYNTLTVFEALNLGGSAKWSSDDDRLTLSTDVSYSRGTGDESNFTYVVAQRPGRTASIAYDVVAGDGNVPNQAFASNFNLLDPANYQLVSVFDSYAPRKNSNLDLRSDIGYKVEAGPLSTITVGARFNKTDLVSSNRQNLPTAANLLAGRDRNGDGALTVDELPTLRYDSTHQGGYFPGDDGAFPRDFLTGTVDRDAARAAFNLPALDLFAPISQGPTTLRDVALRTWAAYAKAGFEGSGYRGNVGLRYSHTSRVSAGYLTGPLAVAVPATFDNWLPSANIAIDLTPKLLVRFAAAKVVAQPTAADVGVGFSPNTTNNTGNRGNPSLRPFEATQYDATAEWYFAPASLLSAALFYKKVSSFTIISVTQEFVTGFSERFGLFNISQPQNGTSGSVKGFELNYQHAFRFLPGPLRNLGVQTNYTYADSRTPIVDELTQARLPLPNLSKHSYSLIGYYDDGRFNARLAYSYRTKSLIQQQLAANAGSRYANAFGQLDASAAFNINDNLRLTFEAQNLNKAINRQYEGVNERVSYAAMEDRRFYAGIGFTF